MIKEWIQFLSTPTEPHVKKMGYLKEAIAMEARYQRCQLQWQSHFENCQQAIVEASERCHQHRKLLILGAGSLKDIPLNRLSEQFEKVLLVDLVFLKSARHQAMQFPNVELVTADISGSLMAVYSGDPKLTKFTKWTDDSTVDCVVSLNLATQLPILPVNWLMEKYRTPEPILNSFGVEMVENHLEYLDQFKAIKCLISDRKVMELNAQKTVIDEFDPAWEVKLPEISMQWEWEIAPLGELSKKYSRTHLVGVSLWS